MKTRLDRSSAMERLRKHLSRTEPGQVPESERSTLAALLTDAWRDLDGNGTAVLPGWSWIGAHEVTWTRPLLTWETWRPAHYYEHLERWTVDVDRACRNFSTPERREMAEPAIQRPVDTAAIADELAPLIVDRRRDDERLQWSKAGRARVPANRVFPPASGQTTTGRRKRLRRDLKKRLAPNGWHPRPLGWWEYTGKTQDPPAWYDELEVCTKCGQLAGRITHPGTGDSASQSCGCGHLGPNMWEAHGILFCGELCRCCRQVLLKIESKFSVWFCRGCLSHVGLLNTRIGRYVIPVGGHSILGGLVLRGDATDVDIEDFVDRWAQITDVITGLCEWSCEVVRRVIAERLPEAPSRIPIETYLQICSDEKDEKSRWFREMLEFLKQRGREG